MLFYGKYGVTQVILYCARRIPNSNLTPSNVCLIPRTHKQKPCSRRLYFHLGTGQLEGDVTSSKYYKRYTYICPCVGGCWQTVALRERAGFVEGRVSGLPAACGN